MTASCAKDPLPWVGVPANYYGDLIWAQYNLTCVKDPKTNQWCNGLYAIIAMQICRKLNQSLDYISNITFPNDDSELTSLPKDQLCSPCVLALAQLMQSTAFSNYDSTIAPQWVSIQTTCGLNLPSDPQPPVLGSSVIVPGYVQANTTFPKSCASGNTYTVISGDDLEKIAEAKGVSSGTLRVINDILPDGSNLFAGSILCLPQTCKTYLVRSGGV